jgi:hypothetical protein
MLDYAQIQIADTVVVIVSPGYQMPQDVYDKAVEDLRRAFQTIPNGRLVAVPWYEIKTPPLEHTCCSDC